MKVLTITDIHQNDLAARSAGITESPDLVLDCGDHERLESLFGTTPHFYINGNHEPSSIHLNQSNALLPTYIPNGTVIQFTDGEHLISFTGIDGNYSAKNSFFQVNPLAIERIAAIDANTLDVLLVHESPLNVPKTSKSYSLANKLMREIERLQPKIVLSGHTNIFSECMNDKQTRYINLDDMCCGYGVIETMGKDLLFTRKQVSWGK